MSEHRTDKKVEMDLSVFKDEHDDAQHCDQHSNDPIEGCNAVKRLISTLKYYTLLDITESKDNRDIFCAFMCEVYLHCLDDFAHLVNEHRNLEEINSALTTNKRFDECNITKCHFTARHHSESINVSMSGVLKFYANTMDSLHYYVFHLYDCGLRAQRKKENNDNSDDDDNRYFDRGFTRISRIIKERQHLSASFNRFKNNTKFNITIQKANEGDSSSSTFMDALFRCVLSNNIKANAIETFRNFIGAHEYDTDSVKTDIKYASYGNIVNIINDQELIKVITEFINKTAMNGHSSSFNIGLIFYYWPKYKDMAEFDQNTNKFNLNDHGGYSISDLFVKQRNSYFKQEIMNYGFLNIDQYESLMVKVKEYMETKNVKGRKAKSAYKFELKYGIKDGDGLLSRHLLALFLYTDYTELCTQFSATFRPIKPFESLSSIKSRNSKYWWMSMSLRECVELYGTKGTYWDKEKKKRINNLQGPFYCGLSVVMPFPGFEVRLCSPTSSSKQITVATRFAGEGGVVVQLNNNIVGHIYISGFECAALSNFKEEDEVIWMGGHHRIRIESVRILNGKGGRCQNFEVFFGALSKFNNMFNGGYVPGGDAPSYMENDKKKINKIEKKIISMLMDWTLGKRDLRNKIDEYVLDTFEAFKQNKRHIVFNYYSLDDNDRELRDIIFYGMKRGDWFDPSVEEKTNVFRKVLFELFPNIQHIDIYTTDIVGDPDDQCALSFLALLSEIQNETFTKITVRAVHEYDYDHKKKNESWIYRLWSSSQKELQEKYLQKGYQILLKNTKNYKNYDEDCVVIKKIY